MDWLISAITQRNLILLYLIPVVLIFKILEFSRKRTSTWKINNFFYFKEDDMITSRSHKNEAEKKTQNVLSLIILLLIFSQIALFFFVV